MAVTSLVCTVGADAIVIDALPKRAPGREWSLTLNAALVVGAVASVIGAALVVAGLPVLSEDFAVLRSGYALVFVVGSAAWTMTTILDYTFVAERAGHLMFVRNGVLSISKLLLLVVAIGLAGSAMAGIVTPWVAGICISEVVAFAVLVPRLRRGYSTVRSGVAAHIRDLRATLVRHHAISLSGALPPLLLPVIVTARLGPTDNAYFFATWMIGTVFFVVSPAVASALFTEGSHNRADLRAKVGLSVRWIAMLLVPVMCVYLVAGREVLAIFGAAYAREGWPVLVLLMISAVPDAVTNIYIAVQRIVGRLKVAASVNIGIAVLSVLLAWVLLPGHGIAGAALAWLVAQSCGAVVVAADLRLNRASMQRRASADA